MLATLPWLLLVVLAGVLALHDIVSVDFWWHLRTGQLIVETGSVPLVDPYTISSGGDRWVDPQWLFQVGLWGVYSLGGLAGVVVAKFLCVLGLLAVLARIGRRPDRDWVSVLALALMLLAMSVRLLVRPEVVTYLLLALTLALLDRFERRGDAWILALVPLQLVWANVQSLFTLSIALCGMHGAAELARPLAVAGEGWRWRRLWLLAAVTGLLCVVPFLNPNGAAGALQPFEYFGWTGGGERPVFGMAIAELAPPLLKLPPSLWMWWLLLAAASLGAMLLNWRELRLSDPLVWTAFFYLSFSATRNLGVFAVVAAPLLVRNLNAWLDRAPLAARPARWAPWILCAGMAAVSLDVWTGGFFLRAEVPRSPGLGADRLTHPEGAADWIEAHRPPGPIAHSMNEGGYFIWRLWPEYPALIDSRTMFGPEVFERYWIRDPGRFQQLDAVHHFGLVHVLHGRSGMESLLPWLASSPEWSLVHVDDVSSLFARRPPPGAALDLDAPGLFPPLEASTPADVYRVHRRVEFLVRVGRPDLALAQLEAGLERIPDLPHGRELRRRLRQALASPARPARESGDG